MADQQKQEAKLLTDPANIAGGGLTPIFSNKSH
jgi:hypothetical protein